MDVVHSRGCFTGHVVTNQWGFRDHERTLAKAPGIFRIALMGDSVVEGAHVNPEQVMNIQMQKQLQAQGYHKVEVMNFAVEGIGTTQEWLMYQQQVRQFHPDMVIVGFSDNDVMNNSSTLQPQSYGIHTWYSPYYNLDQNGTLVFQPVEKRYFGSLVNFLEKHSYLVYYGERVWYRADLPLHHWRGMPVYYGTYGDDPLDADWQQAWKVTGKVMARFRDDVQADGARFVLIPWPNFSEIDPQWRERLTRQFGQLPRELKPERLNDRLQAMAASEGITISSLTPYLLAYRDSHHLQWPYFSLPCDPHFSAMGHQVVAGALVQTLEQSHWLPSPTAH
jgi:lysophospholipase L1-like esterase